MSKGTTHRTLRVDDELWDAAKAKASERGDNLSEILRQRLRDYLNEGDSNEQ